MAREQVLAGKGQLWGVKKWVTEGCVFWRRLDQGGILAEKRMRSRIVGEGCSAKAQRRKSTWHVGDTERRQSVTGRGPCLEGKEIHLQREL